MKSILTAIFTAVALSLAAAGAQAIEKATAVGGASSVADMQLRKQDADLRAQLVKEGRWEEIRNMDEVTARRLQAQRDQRYIQVNEALSHNTGAEGQLIDARALDCDPTTTHVR